MLAHCSEEVPTSTRCWPKASRQPARRRSVDRARSLLDRALGPSKVLTGPRSASPTPPMTPTCPARSPTRWSSPRRPTTSPRAGDRTGRRGPDHTESAGSGRTGAVPIAGGIVLVTLGMAQIKESTAPIGCVVEPGVITGDLHAAVEREGLFYPPDPNSLKMCAIGGNVAENAGGPRAFKYGVTRDYVLGLEAILMGGTRLRTGRRTRQGRHRLRRDRAAHRQRGHARGLQRDHAEADAEAARSGDAARALRQRARAADAVAAIVARGLVPRCLELLDAGTLAAVRARGVAIDARAGAMLLIEVDGDARALRRAAPSGSAKRAWTGTAIDVLVAQDAAQRERLWAARREMSPAVRALSRHKLSEDVVVPRQRIVELLDQVDRTSEATGIRTVTYGHAGDGNLHVNFLWTTPTKSARRSSAAIEQLFRDVVAMRGTLSGEHGIGVAQSAVPAASSNRASSSTLQKTHQGGLRSQGALNPGKIFPAGGHRAC